MYLYGSVTVFLRFFSLSPSGTLFQSMLQSQAPLAKPFSSPPPWGSMLYLWPWMESIRGTVHTVLTQRMWGHGYRTHRGGRNRKMSYRKRASHRQQSKTTTTRSGVDNANQDGAQHSTEHEGWEIKEWEMETEKDQG